MLKKIVRITTKENNRSLKIIASAAILMAMPSLAMAAGTPWDGLAEKIIEVLNGGLARSVAIIAVMALGAAAMVGKLDMKWAINIGLGITFMFGAAKIVDLFTGS